MQQSDTFMESPSPDDVRKACETIIAFMAETGDDVMMVVHLDRDENAPYSTRFEVIGRKLSD